MAGKSVSIRVPATIGSIAGATNSAAVALDASLNVNVTTRFDGCVSIRYFGDHGERVPRDRSNLVVQALEAALRFKGLEFTGADFQIYSSVPVGVGLGSSCAAVLAGLIAADRLYHLELQERAFFELAAVYESRSDSLRAAWLGGFVAHTENGAAGCRRIVLPENTTLSVVIPEIALVPGSRNAGSPGAVRESSPERTHSPEANSHSDRARQLAEFFARPATGDTSVFASVLPVSCEKVVPGLTEALEVRTPGVAVFVCGSGPAVAVLAQGDPAPAVRAVRQGFERHGIESTAVEFRLSNAGAREWNAVPPDLTLPRAVALGPSAKKISLIPV